MRFKLILSSSLAVALFAVFGAGAAGCGPSPAAVCDAKCACEGCSQLDFDRCVNERSNEGEVADFRGCGAYYSDYLACQNATAVCHGDHFETSCGPEKDVWKHCVDGKR